MENEAMNAIEMNNANIHNCFLTADDIKMNNSVVIHPLFDLPEEKVDVDAAPPLKMSKSVKWSLLTLRVYLIIMVGLAFYRTMVMAGIVGSH
jgi:hypothetical protein